MTRSEQRLSDTKFWRLSSELSEGESQYESTALISNEPRFQDVVPELLRRANPAGAYVGVGVEQNFTYIAASRPAFAIVLDVRKAVYYVHLMYKALFEVCLDRVDFVTRLFGRHRPPELDATSSAAAIFDAYSRVDSDPRVCDDTLAAILHHLSSLGGLAGQDAVADGVASVYRTFCRCGPQITYSSRDSPPTSEQPSYAELMTANDPQGRERSFLATEDDFLFLAELQRRNMVLPIIGDVGGPHSVRGIGQYLKAQKLIVSTCYLSNVEPLLHRRDGCRALHFNVTTLPICHTSTLIRARCPEGSRGLLMELQPLMLVLAATVLPVPTATPRPRQSGSLGGS